MKNKKMRKTGQVSFFVLLGVLLLIIVGFIIYLVAFSTKERTEREVVTTQQMPTELQEINNYVVGCLDKVTQDGLELIGKRGGRITTDEGGTYNPTYHDDGVHILKDDDREEVMYSIRNAWVIQGVNLLPALLDVGGNSIYENLKGYIHYSLIYDDEGGEACLEEGKFNDVFEGKGFRIDSNPLTRKVVLDITDNDVKVSLNYPLTITNKATGEKRELEDFYVIEKIRLKEIHEFLKQTITKEVNDKRFDLANNRVAGFDNNIKIKEVRQGKNLDYDDIIEVVDENSLLKGKPYSFRFARMNRKPVADFEYLVSQTQFDPSKSHDPDEDDIVAWEWDFDNSGNVDSGDKEPIHSYSPSTHDASLRVQDSHYEWSRYAVKEIII